MGHACRRVAALLLVLAIAAAPSTLRASGFGRFGYASEVPIPRFEVDRKGFRTRHPMADKLAFEDPLTRWQPLLTSDTGQTLDIGGINLSPRKLRADLFGEGFQLYFQNGFALHLQSLAAPYLSWFEGSVGPGVPTPETTWVLLTFRDEQPPILFGFPGKPCAMILEGRSGDWKLRSTAPYTGWMRVATPIGLSPFRANTVGELGTLVARIKADAAFLSRTVPKLVSTKIDEDPNGVTTTWQFDGPGAVLPQPVLLAPMGGYPLKSQGEQRRLQIQDALGPVTVAASDMISLRFPVRRVPTGRCLSLGDAVWSAPATVSAIDVPSVAELAIANLGSQRDASVKSTAENSLDEFLRTAIYEQEPHTGQSFPYSASGKGVDVAAAQALLMQCAMNAEKATSEPNSLLTSIIWRRDWYTWLVWTPNAKLARRATALAALAAAFCPEKERRLDAAMFQAGLAAERGLMQWRKSKGIPADAQTLIEPLEPLRNAVFAMAGHPAEQDAFLKMLQSEVRVYGEMSVSAEKGPDAFALHFTAPDANRRTLVLASAYPLKVVAGMNIESVETQDALGFTIIKYAARMPGRSELWVTAPDWASPLPLALPLLRYEEPER